jgi:LAO/AO transport system kinase
MNNVSTDPGVFIRSMAARGSLGGLATTTEEVADVMDAFGFDRLLLETVGVGQSELDIAGAADSTVVVLVPEAGDSIQAMKAGLMEVADIFVINKADRPGADRLAQEIEVMLHMRLGAAQPAAAGHHGVSLQTVGRAMREQRREKVRDAGAGDQDGGARVREGGVELRLPVDARVAPRRSGFSRDPIVRCAAGRG